MPELPEVQTVVTGLQQIVGKTILSWRELRSGTVLQHLPSNTSAQHLGIIKTVTRRGKYILITTSTQITVVIHLRMTGRLLMKNKNAPLAKHTQALIQFQDNTCLHFVDPRTFGKIEIYPHDQQPHALQVMGPEPLESAFNPAYLLALTRRRTAPIKNLILNQSVVAGLGNIYVCEALYRARIRPQRTAASLTLPEAKRLYQAIVDLLAAAIAHQGTTFSDYRTIRDQSGNFQQFLRVYHKNTCPEGHIIKIIRQAGRSSFYCPTCQK